jgi:DNA-binding NtrC family response regulator
VHPHTILVVEDEILVRLTLRAILEDGGFSALEAQDAAQAIEIIERTPGIDLLFTDVQMPGEMDGLGLAKWMIENRPATPVIIASGNPGMTNAAMELCGAVMFPKPYDFESAVVKIRQTIESRRKR